MPNRLRFAPSPTGALHIGGIRTALYNFLLAKQKGGQFILRIEDTDQNRYVPGAEEYITKSLQWLGLINDEGPAAGGPFGPYRQSERLHMYKNYALKLVDEGKAYYAWDTPEELDQRRKSSPDHSFKYDASIRSEMNNSLHLSSEEVEQKLNTELPYTIRLKVEPGVSIKIQDKVRGEVIFDSTELDDKVLFKADGYPTYHLANVVDDHLMEVTDVIRGEEWLPSTAHHVLLYKAFGWEDSMPAFSHLPLILKPSGNGKLSKRDGQKFGFPVFPMAWPSDDPKEAIDGFDTYGFEPEAVVNFLAMLGWNPGTEQEIFSLEELISSFDPEKIHKAGARFDYEKALWFNQQYVHKMSFSDAEDRLRQQSKALGYDLSAGDLKAAFKLLQPRVQFLHQIMPMAYYFFSDDIKFDEESIEKKWKPEVAPVLTSVAEALQTVEPFSFEAAGSRAKEVIKESGVKMGLVMPMLRVALTGTMQGPDVFAIAEVLGSQKSIDRIQRFAAKQTQ